jgi:type III restriction enzyme
VDRLSIVDRFQEIIDDANRPDSTIRMQSVVLDPRELQQRSVTVVSQSTFASQIGSTAGQTTGTTVDAGRDVPPLFTDPEERKVARLTYETIQQMAHVATELPSVAYLNRPEVRAAVIRRVREEYRPVQQELEGVVTPPPDIESIVELKTKSLQKGTIDIRRCGGTRGDVRSGYTPFQLSLDGLRYLRLLRTGYGIENSAGQIIA